MSIKRIVKYVMAWTLLATLSGCAGLTEKPQSPRVSLSNINILELGIFEQRYGLSLRIQNPNSFALPLAGMSYQLYINDESFAQGVSNDHVTIPAFGEEMVEVNVVSNLGQLAKQLTDIGSQPRPLLQYRLDGQVKLDNFVRSIPFSYAGEVKFEFAPK